MKALLLLLAVLPGLVFAKTTLIQKDSFVVTCGGVVVSSHTTYHKAVESAVNNAPCAIDQPLVEVSTTVVACPVVPEGTVCPICPVCPPLSDIKGGDVEVIWQAPTQRVDGTALLVFEIDHYKVTAKEKISGSVRMFDVVTVDTSITRVLYLPQGDWEFSVVAIDTKGLSSAASNVVQRQVPTPPTLTAE